MTNGHEEHSAYRRQTYILFTIVCLACALGSLTQTVMNSMLDGVQQTFGTDDATSQWLTTVYMLGIGLTVPVVTHLSRRMGMRTLVLLSLAFSLAGGLVAAVSPNFWVLFFARVMQSIGTGITLPILQTVAMVRFPKGQNATAMGIAGIAMGFAPNIGPLIGGALVNTLGWRSFYWMYLVVVVAMAFVAVALLRKESAPAAGGILDYPSLLLSIAGFGLLLVGLSNVSSMGIGSVWVWVEVALGAVGVALFIMRQGRCENPLISMDVFRSRVYAMSFVCQDLLFGSFMGITLILPLFVINISHMGPVEAGMVFLPATAVAVFVNPIAGIATDRIGQGPVIVCGGVFLTVGAASMAFMDASTPLWLMMVLQGIRGVGVSTLVGPLVSWGLSDLGHRVMVDGSAFFTALRQASASLGTAVMMAFIIMGGGIAETVGYNLAFGFSATLSAALLLCVSLSFLRRGSNGHEGDMDLIETEARRFRS